MDYYSKYPEFTQLPDKTAKTIVAHTKSLCSRHGIPEEIISDNMPFNSQAERFVQTLTNLLKKADEDGRDPYLELLEYRNTPITGLEYSPAQLLMGRTLRSKVPTAEKLLRPKVVDAHDALKRRQVRQKTYYDKHAAPLAPLRPGDVVRVQRGNSWEPAIVADFCDQPWSYTIQTKQGLLHRNRRHLRKSAEHPPLFIPPTDDNAMVPMRPPPRQDVRLPKLPPADIEPPDIEPPEPVVHPEPAPTDSGYKTRRGPAVKAPSYLNDYV